MDMSDIHRHAAKNLLSPALSRALDRVRELVRKGQIDGLKGGRLNVLVVLEETLTGAISPADVHIDHVGSSAEAAEFCSKALPHAVIYESALAGPRFHQWRSRIQSGVPSVAFIEIAKNGHAVTMSAPERDRTAAPVAASAAAWSRVGRASGPARSL